MNENTRDEDIYQAISQFWETVPPVWNQVRNQLRSKAVEQFNISVEQFHVLRLIRRGLTSVSEIADSRQTSRPAVSQNVENLVRRGLITRRQAENDRRYVHLALTPEGEDLLSHVFQQNRAWMREKMTSFSPAELSRITEGLALLKSVFFPPEPEPEGDLVTLTGKE